MQKKTVHKSVKCILCVALLITLLMSIMPMSALADWANMPKQSKDSIVLKASAGDDVLTVKKGESAPDEKDISLSLTEKTIERDYDQKYTFTVTNNSDKLRRLYFDVKNEYPDLSMEITTLGTKNNNLFLKAGESETIELSIFAQNAEKETYDIPVTAYEYTGADYEIVEEGTAIIKCTIPKLDLSWEEIESDPTVLSKTIRLTNNGDSITDLTLSAEGELADYVSFEPFISNYGLSASQSVEFSISPDLAKMKADNVEKITGNITAKSAGMSTSYPVVFDTEGKPITITTMGELAKKQSGNPITKFEPVEGTLSIKTFDGEKYSDKQVESATEILDENGYFSVRVQTDVDLGLSEPATIVETITTQEADYTKSVPTEPTIKELDNGNIEITSFIRVSSDEYKAMVGQAGGSNQPAKRARTLLNKSPSDDTSVGQQVDIYVKQEIPKSLVNEIIKEATLLDVDPGAEAYTEEVFSALGYITDGIETAETVYKTAKVWENPNLNTAEKAAYTGVSAVKEFARWGSNVAEAHLGPLGGFLLDFTTGALIHLMDNWQDKLVSDADRKAAITQMIQGYQCTNRGSIDTKFYVPKQKRRPSKPSGASGDDNTQPGDAEDENTNPGLHVTSRMYQEGDKYVDQDDVNFDLTLNGQPAGVTHNTGLTDYVIMDIPTDNLIPGKTNTLTADYDTMPGNYFVNTDTTVTITYADDEEIGFIGSPDTYRDIRNLPDAVINPENIYTQDDLVVGEPTSISFKAYNIGGYSGWFTIKATVDGQEVFAKKNQYIKAFSYETFSVPYTPTKSNTEFSVELTNATINVDERRTDNNKATKTISARERQVPVLGEFETSTNYTGMENLYYIEIGNSLDITTVDFYLDGIAVGNDSVSFSAVGDSKLYCVAFPEGVESGEHTLAVTVGYNTVQGSDTISKTYEFGVKSSTILFQQEKEYSSPSYYYLSPYDSSIACHPTKNEDGSYTLQADSFVANNLSELVLVVVYDKGLVYSSIKGWEGTVLQDNTSTVNFKAPTGYKISAIDIRQVNGLGLAATLNSSVDSYEFSPGNYSLEIQLDPTGEGRSYVLNKEITVLEEDITVDLSKAITVLNMTIQNPRSSFYNVLVLAKSNTEDYWEYYYPDTNYNNDTGTIAASISGYESERFLEYDKYKLVINSDTELFIVDRDNLSESNPIKLNSSDLRKVTFKHDKDLTVGNTSIRADGLSFSMYGEPLYITAGDYHFEINCRTKDQALPVEKDVSLNEDTVIDISIPYEEFSSMMINYDERYTKLPDLNIGNSSSSDVKNGSTVYHNGSNGFYAWARLNQDDAFFEVEHFFEPEDDVAAWNIGAEFEGELSLSSNTVQPGKALSSNLFDLKDKQNNRLNYAMANDDNPLSGYVVYTNTSTKDKEYVAISSTDMNPSISAPEKEGEYTVSMVLFTKATQTDPGETPSEPNPSEPDDTDNNDDKELSGIAKGLDGKWAMYKEGVIDASYTGVAKNEYGWWRVKNGYVDFNAQGVYRNEYGWWKTTDGKVNFNETGVFKNEFGWWRVEDSKVNFKANGIYKNAYGWWKTKDGKVTFDETGVFKNEYGWWRVEKSKVNFKANGIYENDYGWWKTTKGKVTFDETGVFKNDYGWWRVEKSKVDFKFTGIAKNKNGTWYVKNGKVDFNKTGKVQYKGKVYTVKEGKVQ